MSTLSCATLPAVSRSPTYNAALAWLRRFHASAWTFPDSRAASDAPSRTRTASSRLPQHLQDRAEHGDEEGRDLGLPGGLRDGQPAFGVAAGIGEAVEVELGRGEIGQRVEPQGQLLVGHRIDQRRGLVTACLRLGLAAHKRERAGHGGRARGDQGRVAEGLGGAEGAPGRGPHGRVVLAIEVPRGQMQEQLDGLHRRGLGQPVERRGEPVMRLAVVAEQLLDSGTRTDEGDAQRLRVAGRELDALQQRRTGLLEAARGRLGAGQRHQQLHPFARGRGRGQQAERYLEPLRRAGRCPLGGPLAGFAQHRHCLEVSVGGRLSDVVGSRRSRRASLG